MQKYPEVEFDRWAEIPREFERKWQTWKAEVLSISWLEWDQRGEIGAVKRMKLLFEIEVREWVMSRTRQNWEFNDCFWDCLFCKVFQKSKKVGGVKSDEDERIIMYVMVMLCYVMWCGFCVYHHHHPSNVHNANILATSVIWSDKWW